MSFFFKKVKNLILKRKSSHFIKPKFCGFSTHSILLNDKALNKLIQSTMSKNIDTIDVYRSLLENYGAVNSSIQISKKFSFFSKVGKLGEKFSMRPIKILENSPMSVLLENKQNRKTNRFAIHFHSIGFVAGSPLDVYKPISHLFEDLNCDKILCVGLNSIEHAKLSDIFETALNAYNYVVRKFEADKSKLIISGSASGCLLTTKILNYLNSKQEKTGEKHPQLHYRMAPIFIRKPSKFYCGAIINFSPLLTLKMDEGKDLLMSDDVIRVINKIVEDKVSKESEEEFMKNIDSNKNLEETLNIVDENNPSFEKLLELRKRFWESDNGHWFQYKLLENRFLLSEFLPFSKQNDEIKLNITTFVKARTNK